MNKYKPDMHAGHLDKIKVQINRGLKDRTCDICHNGIPGQTYFVDILLKRHPFLLAHQYCIRDLSKTLELFVELLEKADNPPPTGEKEKYLKGEVFIPIDQSNKRTDNPPPSDEKEGK